jgi:hypothetical protein
MYSMKKMCICVFIKPVNWSSYTIVYMYFAWPLPVFFHIAYKIIIPYIPKHSNLLTSIVRMIFFVHFSTYLRVLHVPPLSLFLLPYFNALWLEHNLWGHSYEIYCKIYYEIRQNTLCCLFRLSCYFVSLRLSLFILRNRLLLGVDITTSCDSFADRNTVLFSVIHIIYSTFSSSDFANWNCRMISEQRFGCGCGLI